jgi:hypothetical protein
MGNFVRACTTVTGLVTALGLMVPVARATQGAAGASAAARTAAAASGSGTAPYPSVGRGTHFLNDRALLGSTDEKAWYEANIPFLDVPDQTIQSTYYYRWRVWKEHVRPTATATC